MAWLKIESSVSRNRKFVKAGPGPSWLWVCGLAYCQEGLTDGFIPDEALPFLGVKNAAQLATHLVAASLWHKTDGGWRVNDYLLHNKSAAEVEAVRVERRNAGSAGGKASGFKRRHGDAEATAKQVAEATTKQPSKPSTTTATEAATETATARNTARPQPIIARRRLDAAWEGPRVYVPQRVHNDFIGLRNHPRADSELWAWYERVSDEWTTGAKSASNPGSDMIRFWKDRYDEEWPPARAAVASSRQPAWVVKK